MKNRLREFLRKKDGGFPIIFVILIFVGCMVAVGFTDLLVRNYTMDEVQSKMDVAGISSLQSGVNTEKLRVQEFVVDKALVKNNYMTMMRQTMQNSDKIKDYKFYGEPKVDVINSKFGIGNSSQNRPQAIIDSTMIIVVDSSQVFDLIPGAYDRYYNSKDGQYFDVKYNGKNEDGKVELSVRSVSRLVYR